MTAKKSKDSLLNMAAGFLDDRVFFLPLGLAVRDVRLQAA